MVHASLVYQWRDWTMRLWARNLGDEEVYVRGYYFGNDPRDGYAAKAYTQLGEPRRFGVTLQMDM